MSGKKIKKGKGKGKGTAGTHQTCVQNFRVYLSKTAWTSDSEGNWVLMLEPACDLNAISH